MSRSTAPYASSQPSWRRHSAALVVLSLLLGLLTATTGTRVQPAAAAGTLTNRWTFDAGSGTTAADSVGGRTATLNGTATSSTTAWQGPATLSLPGGTANNATTSGSVVNTTSSFSVSAHVRLNVLGGFQTVVSQDGTNVSAFYLQLRDNGRFGFTRLTSDSTAATAVFAAASNPPVVDQWYHLVGVYDAVAGTQSLYVDGRLQQTVTAAPAWASTGSLAIGRGRFNGLADAVNGSIDDVRVYNGPLTAAEVQQLAAPGAQWRFEEGSGTTAADTSGNAYTATAVGSPSWTTGVPGTAIQLNGTSQYLSANQTVLDTTRDFSVTAWARPAATGAARTVLSVPGANASAFDLQQSAGNQWVFSRRATDTTGATPTTVTSAATLTTGSWYHLAAVYNSSAQTMTLYVNGASAVSVAFTGGFEGAGKFRIGASGTTTTPATFFSGGIDEVNAYPYVIDASAISTQSKAAPPVPAAPDATAGQSSATVSWSAPAPIAGSPTTGYVVTPIRAGTAETPRTFTSTATSQTITGLTAGTSYTFTVAATNANGTSSPSAASNAVTPYAVPAAPTITTASAGTQSATLTWTTPANNGSTITGYVVTPYIGATAQTARTFASTATTQTITGLTAGTSYTFRVAATNAAGTGPQSASSSAVTPNATPTITTATLPNGRVGTAYSQTLAVSGGTPPYTWSVSAGALPAGVTLSAAGVLSGTPTATGSSTFTARVQDGSGSAATRSLTLVVTDPPATPSAPTATAGQSSATVSWTAPTSATAITGYTVTPYRAGVAQPAQTFDASTTTRTLTGLTPGSSYTFTVAATNASDTSSASAPSNAVVPFDVPSAPAAPTATAGVQRVTVSWAAPASNGSALTAYRVTPYVNGTAQTPVTFFSTATTQTITGLTAGTAYTFTVAAQNNVGFGPESPASNAATPTAGAPDRPSAPTATRGETSAVVSWSAPATNGSAITGYVLTPYLNGTAQTPVTVDPSAKTRTLPGLTAGGSYTFTVAAQSAAGTSAASPASNVVVPYAPLGAPTITSVSAGSTSARLSWTAPSSTGGSPITGYVITPYLGGVAQTPQTFASTATTQTVTGLTAGQTYTFTVAAQNTSGTTVLYRVDAGGAEQPALDGGPVWAADNTADSPYRPTGSSATNFGPVNGVDWTVPATTPPAIFDTERWDPGPWDDLRWAFPVAAGTPTSVRLYFAEAYFNGTGARSFDVALDGTTVLPDLDVFAAAGGFKTGTMREFAVTSDGTVDLDFRRVRDNPKVDGIEILQTGTATAGPPSAQSSPATPNANPTLTFPDPPAGQVNVAYATTLSVTGGTAPYTWSVSAGSLPPGLTLSSSTGQLSGTPTAAGSTTFTVRVVDASGQAATRDVTLVVVAPPAFTFTPAQGEVGVAYSQQPTRTGGTGPYTWSVTAGTLPAGLSLNTSTGLVSGTPTAAGTSSVTLRVSDANNQTASRTVTFSIAAQPTLTSQPPSGRAGVRYSYTFVASGGIGPFTYSVVAGALPAGLSLSASGVLSGTPPNAGTSSFTVRATDANGQTATLAATLLIDRHPIQVTKSASSTSAAPGDTVTFTVTATNISAQTYNGVQYNDPLTDVLDDATYNGDVTVTSGIVGYNNSILTWSANMPAGASVTMTYTVTVANPGTGNQVLGGSVYTSFASTSCYPGSTLAGCSAPVYVSGLAITTTASPATTTPGSQVTFTITASNTGQAAYSSASLSQSLAGILDDASYTGGAAATTGNLSYANQTLSWSGALAVGASVTITYKVTVLDPDPGNRSLTATAVSSSAGSTCPGGNPAASCTATVPVLVPALGIQVSAPTATTTPGSQVPYTVTLANTGQTAYAGTSVTIGLAAALDDGTSTGATASAGSLSTAGSDLIWTGDLALGASVTITVPVTISDPDPGDRMAIVSATSAAAGSTCPVGTTTTSCRYAVQVLVPALTSSLTASTSTTTPGSVVSYSLSITNTGQTAYTAAALAVDLSGVLDDATWNGSATSSAGAASLDGTTLRWSGDLAVGASATVTYAVTVRDPDPADRSLASRVTSTTAGTNCRTGSTDPRCTSTVAVLLPGLTLSTTASATSTEPGGVVRLGLEVHNTGQTTYTGLQIRLENAGIVDDADFNGDGTVSTGTLTPGLVAIWTLTLAPGQSASTGSSVTVRRPPTGDRALVSRVSTTAAGSNCPPSSTDPACGGTVPILLPGLTLTKTADAAAVTPGDRVTYTVTALNSGETTIASAAFSDDLTRVLTDAVYAGDARASRGTVAFSGAVLSWSGALAPGDSATLTYSVVVRDPDPGDKRLINTVVSSTSGSNCPTGSSDTRCTTTVNVLVPALTIAASTDVASTVPGGVVRQTVRVTNSGATPYTGAVVDVPLEEILDDATYANGMTASSGTASLAGSTVHWSGDLAVGASATFSFSVTVRAENVGDNLLNTTVTSPTRGSQCPAPAPGTGGDPRCTSSVPVARLLLVRSPQEASTTPGSVVHLPVTFTNIGQVPYTGISVTIPRADTADDVVAAGEDVPSSGTISRTAEATVWTGNIPVGGVVTIDITRTVRNPPTGNRVIRSTLQSNAPGNNCPVGGSDPRCSMAVPVLVPALSITKTADRTRVEPGQQTSYTVTIANTGETPYAGAAVTDELAGVLDDAALDEDADATTGTLSRTGSTLTWTGDLAVGASATVTYSVTAGDGGGDHSLLNSVTSTAPGSSCPTGTTSTACRVNVRLLTPQLRLTKTADTARAPLGSTVTYTIQVANTGETSYASADFTDSLAGVLDDATYLPEATTSSRGSLSYANGVLDWSGPLAAGESATISYAVRVVNPASGDRAMTNTVVSTTAGSTCPAGSTDTGCAATVAVVNATTLVVSATTSSATTVPGGVVGHTVTVTNTASTATPAQVAVDLAGVLDDAASIGDVTASAGTAAVSGEQLTWAGTVPARSRVTITYAVTVTTGAGGDQRLVSTVSSPSAPGSNNCAAGSPDPRCTADVPVARLLVATAPQPAGVTPGSVLTFSVTFTNTGQVPYDNISLDTYGSDLLDDVFANGDESISSGTFTLLPDRRRWTGSIPVGGTVAISASLVVRNPPTGNKVVATRWTTQAPGSNCAEASTDPRCGERVEVWEPELTITKSVSATAVAAGDTVTHTVTVHNSGEAPYDDAVVTDTLSGALDDADYNDDALASAGSVVRSGSTLVWTGDLAVGAVATFSYSVTTHDPPTGDRRMTDRVSSEAAGSTCPPASGDPACTTTTTVLNPALTITSTADVRNATLGSTITLTVEVSNTGETSYPEATFSAALAAALDDASVVPDSVSASRGAATVAGTELSWTGALDPGESATITLQLGANNPATGDRALTSVVTSTSSGSNCPAGGVDSRCRVSVPITNAVALTMTKTADRLAVARGGGVAYTVKVTNASESDLDAEFTDPLAAILDDASYAGGATATAGSVDLVGTDLVWSGTVPAGGTVSVTYAVTVSATLSQGQDQILTGTVRSPSLPGSNNCAEGSSDPRCTATVTIAALELQQGFAETSATPGSLLHFTATFTNTGATAYEGISVATTSNDIFDDVALGGQLVVTSGSVTLAAGRITWTGDIAAGSTVTIAATLLVKRPPGNRLVTGTLSSTALGGNCPAGASDPRCTASAAVLIPGLTVTKTADRSTAAPGDLVTYTVTARNSGEAAYGGATVRDALTGVLDDADYQADAVASTGTVSYAGSTLTWSTPLAVGQSATLTYSVRVATARAGDKSLVNTAVSNDDGSTCPTGTGNAACRAEVRVLTPRLTLTATADQVRTTLGSQVAYTVTVANTGEVAYPAAEFAADLAGVLDDAALTGTPTASRGTVTSAGGVLSWSGALGLGEVATVSYAVTVANPSAGDRTMTSVLTSSSAGSTCAAGSTDPRCSTRVEVTNATALTVTKSADVATTRGGGRVQYVLTVLNSSSAAIPGATLTDSLAGVLDDASYAGDAAASAGTVTVDGEALTWTGTVAAGEEVDITYSVVVADDPGGDLRLTGRVSSPSTPGSNNCGPDSTDSRCADEVLVARLTISQQAPATAIPGQVIEPLGVFSNTGQVPYAGISIELDTTDVTDDAFPVGDTATAGQLVRTPTGLIWQGDLAVGATVTVTRRLQVRDPDPGNKSLSGAFSTTAEGSNCAPGSPDPRCAFAVSVLVPRLSIAKTANQTSAVGGSTVTYTVTVANTGETAYTGASVRDDLTGVLDDATYSGDAVATRGTVALVDAGLTWTGDLEPGQRADITYTVLVHRPLQGDRSMVNTVSSTDPGSTCPPGSSSDSCTSTVVLLTPGLTTVVTASAATTTPGAEVTYTVTGTNTGQTDYANAVFSTSLAGLLDDAEVGPATASRGTVVRSGSSLNWAGPLPQGAQVTVSFTVSLARPGTGDHLLQTTVTSVRSGTNCAAGSPDPRCSATVPVAELRVVNTADVATTTPTSVVNYEVTFTNVGQVPYVDATLAYDLTGAVDDATYNGDAAASAGSLTIFVGQGRVSWTGDVAVGDTVTITGSVTVRNPDPGNKLVTTRVLATDAEGTNCAAGSADPACVTEVSVLTPELSITKESDDSTTTPGGTVAYTITATNTGEAPYAGATLRDDLAGLLTEAEYLGDATATRGEVALVGDVLTWTGDLAVGEDVVITYRIRVHDPDLGDRVLANRVTSEEVGSSCPTDVGSGAPPAGCSTQVAVRVPALALALVPDVSTTTPGSTVSYTLSITNTGETAYPGAAVTTALAGLLDDAAYGGDAAASSGSLTYAEGDLTWTGDLPVGGEVTVSFSVLVGQPDALGDRTLSAAVSSAEPGSGCDPADPCLTEVAVLLPALAVSTSADLSTAVPGDRVRFTVTITNTGETDYAAASVTTSLADLLDDATFGGMAMVSSGLATYSAPTLTWTGSLAQGQTATVVVPVRVRNPVPGDRTLTLSARSADAGSTCPAEGAAPTCTATVPVLVPALTLSKTADAATTTPGDVVRYTVVVANTGQTPYTDAVVTDDLDDVLVDADYQGDAQAGAGVVGLVGTELRWTGDLAVGASVTLTYSVRVHATITGDRRLDNAVASTEAGSTCRPGSTAAACWTAVQILVPALEMSLAADKATVVAGSPVRYTVTLSNTGETDYLPATVTDPLDGVLDDADYNADAVASSGSVTYADGTLAWSGPLARGETATITFTVTPRYPLTGNRELTHVLASSSAGAGCPAGGDDQRCRSAVPVLEPALSITKTADRSRVVAGGMVHYTVEATNTGQSDYAAATVTDSLADVLDDGEYLEDATADRGELDYADDTLTWTGSLPRGERVLITYGVRLDLVGTGNASLVNTATSAEVGSSCPAEDPAAACTATVDVDARVVEVSGMTSDFTLVGAPGSTPSEDSAVVMTVTTNSETGYRVTVQGRRPALTGSPGNPDTIPLDHLRVRGTDSPAYVPLSQDPLLVHQSDRPTSAAGDAVSNDYAVDVPFVNSDTYSTELDYIVTAE